MEKGHWEYTAISWDFGPRGVQWGSFRKTSQEGPGREQERGVQPWGPGEVLRNLQLIVYFLFSTDSKVVVLMSQEVVYLIGLIHYFKRDSI